MPPEEDDVVGNCSDNLGKMPKLIVDLSEDITDATVDPTSCHWESDTDVWAPPTLENVAADVDIEEISTLLCEVPSSQPQCLETPELSGSNRASAPAKLTPPFGSLASAVAVISDPGTSPGSGR